MTTAASQGLRTQLLRLLAVGRVSLIFHNAMLIITFPIVSWQSPHFVMCIAVVYFIYLLSISMSVLSLSFMSNFICLVMGLSVLVVGGSPMQSCLLWWD